MKWKCLATIAAVFTMACSVPAYANNDDAVAAYQKMQARMSEWNEVNLFYDYKVDTVAGQKVSSYSVIPAYRIEMDLKATDMKSPETLRFNIYTRSTMGLGEGKAADLTEENGLSFYQNMYYEAGALYANISGFKYKVEVPVSETMEPTDFVSGMTGGPDELKDMKLSQEGDNQVISFTMDPGWVEESDLTLLSGTLAASRAGEVTGYRDARGEYVIDGDGDLVKVRTYMTMDMSIYGEPAVFTVNGEIGVADPEKPVEIMRPELSGYQLME